MRRSVSSPDETLRRELKIWRAAGYFWRTLRCFIWWWNNVSNAWYYLILLKQLILEGEIMAAKMSSFSSDFQTFISSVFSSWIINEFEKVHSYYSRPAKQIESIIRKLLLPLALLDKSLVVLFFLQFRPRLLPRNTIQHSFLFSNILQLMSHTRRFFSCTYRKKTMREAKQWLKPKVNRLRTMNLIAALGKKSKNRD